MRHVRVHHCLKSAAERTTRLLQDYEIFDFDGPGVAMGMYNTEHAIRGFALSCFEYALEKQWCVEAASC